MFPLTPTLSPKGRGGRPCQFLCEDRLAHREVACSPLTPTLSPKGRGGRPCQFFVGSLSPQGGRIFPLTPTLSPKGRGGRPCPFFCGDLSAYRAPDEVAVMEGGGTRGNARHRFGGTGGIHQHKAGGILGFRPYPLAVVVQRQHVAGRYP